MNRMCLSFALPALAALLLVSGCGTTPRDEFIYKRTVVLRPDPGDGSRIAARDDDRRTTGVRLSRSVAQASVPEGAE